MNKLRERIGLAFGLAGLLIIMRPMFDLMSEPGTGSLFWAAVGFGLVGLGGAILPEEDEK